MRKSKKKKTPLMAARQKAEMYRDMFVRAWAGVVSRDEDLNEIETNRYREELQRDNRLPWEKQ